MRGLNENSHRIDAKTEFEMPLSNIFERCELSVLSPTAPSFSTLSHVFSRPGNVHYERLGGLFNFWPLAHNIAMQLYSNVTIRVRSMKTTLHC